MSANIDDVDPRNHDNIFEMTLNNSFLFFLHSIFNEKINKIRRSNQGHQFEHPEFTQYVFHVIYTPQSV